MDLDRVFSFHPPKDEETAMMHQAVRQNCRSLAKFLSFTLPECEEKKRALDAVDDAMKHSNAAIARERA
jgi:hypothetical protein